MAVRRCSRRLCVGHAFSWSPRWKRWQYLASCLQFAGCARSQKEYDSVGCKKIWVIACDHIMHGHGGVLEVSRFCEFWQKLWQSSNCMQSAIMTFPCRNMFFVVFLDFCAFVHSGLLCLLQFHHGRMQPWGWAISTAWITLFPHLPNTCSTQTKYANDGLKVVKISLEPGQTPKLHYTCWRGCTAFSWESVASVFCWSKCVRQW